MIEVRGVIDHADPAHADPDTPHPWYGRATAVLVAGFAAHPARTSR